MASTVFAQETAVTFTRKIVYQSMQTTMYGERTEKTKLYFYTNLDNDFLVDYKANVNYFWYFADRSGYYYVVPEFNNVFVPVSNELLKPSIDVEGDEPEYAFKRLEAGEIINGVFCQHYQLCKLYQTEDGLFESPIWDIIFCIDESSEINNAVFFAVELDHISKDNFFWVKDKYRRCEETKGLVMKVKFENVMGEKSVDWFAIQTIEYISQTLYFNPQQNERQRLTEQQKYKEMWKDFVPVKRTHEGLKFE
ncbi:MAG: hypothetical protein FWH23_01355 [Bacteroidales bacterium]|nr:hypothetical protein [Bacteroidales bacterium]